MAIDASSGSRWNPSTLATLLSRLPLVVSGGARRFAEDPWRGWAAATRAAPWLHRWAPQPARGVPEVLRCVANEQLDDAREAASTIDDPAAAQVAELAIRRGEGDLVAIASMQSSHRGLRHQIRAARRELSILSDPLPTWAAQHCHEGSAHSLDANADESVEGRWQQPRVLHVVTNSLPRVQAGSTIRTHHIASAQSERGWQVAVATRPGFPVFHGDVTVERERTYDGVQYLSLIPRVMPRPERVSQTYAELLADVVDRWQPNVIHGASDHVNARAALEVGRRRNLPVAYEARTLPEESWLSRHGGESARKSDTFELMHRRHREVLLAADVVTTLGENMRTAICDIGVDPQRVFVVPNAVSPTMLGPRRSAGEARDRLGIAGGELLLGSVTTMYAYEGLETMIEAAARLRRQDLDARLLLVGSGPERERWIALAHERGVPVTAPGRVAVTDVVDYLDALDVFVLPRRDDAITRWVTALKPLEAQARAVPVVGTHLPAVAEVLAPGSTLVTGHDPGDWAEALAGMTNPLVREEAGRQAREWVGACRTWPCVLEGYASAYAFVGVNPGDGAGISGR
jgi:glycosyltransferase involved in cell wall biosynthesis